jgi:hypothetical protein
VSTGTNNAYPELRESTITGLAVGLYATGAAPPSVAVVDNKLLAVSINDGETTDVALVDVVVSTDRYIGARALWRTETLVEVFVTFADPEAIGMSAIAGALQPVGRTDPHGLHVELRPGSERRVLAAIGPGMVEPIGIGGWRDLEPGVARPVSLRAGTLALDGERELELGVDDRAEVVLVSEGFRSIDVGGVMRWAAASGHLLTR